MAKLNREGNSIFFLMVETGTMINRKALVKIVVNVSLLCLCLAHVAGAQTESRNVLLLNSAGNSITIGSPASVTNYSLLFPGTIGVQGGIIYLSSVAGSVGTATWLPFTGTATRYLSNTGGAGTVPSWSQIDLTTGVTGVLPPLNGGTGVANANTNTLTLGGPVTFAGAFGTGVTFNFSGTTGVNFPTSGTLATTTSTNFIFNQTTQQASSNFNITGQGQGASFTGTDAATGTGLTVRGGNGSAGAGAALTLSGGTSTGTSAGAGVSITGTAASTTGSGGAISITGGAAAGAGAQNGGNISLTPGAASGTGVPGVVLINTGRELRLNNSANTFYTGFISGATSSVTYTLPATFGNNNDVLSILSGGGTAAPVLTWVPGGGTLTATTGVQYNLVGPQNTADITTSKYLFNVAYAASATGNPALGAQIASTAGTSGNNAATGLTLTTTASGTGTAKGIVINTVSGSGIGIDITTPDAPTGDDLIIQPGASTTAATVGPPATLQGGTGGTTGAGGQLTLAGGVSGAAAGTGGSVVLRTAASGTGTTLADRLTISPAGNATLNTAGGSLAFTASAGGTATTTFLAGNQSGNSFTYTLPIVAPTAGQVLSSPLGGASSALSWATGLTSTNGVQYNFNTTAQATAAPRTNWLFNVAYNTADATAGSAAGAVITSAATGLTNTAATGLTLTTTATGTGTAKGIVFTTTSGTGTAIDITTADAGVGDPMLIQPGASTTAATAGPALTLQGGTSNTSGTGGQLNLQGGTTTSGTGGSVVLTASNGVGTNQAGGNITLNAGTATGTGTVGLVKVNTGRLDAVHDLSTEEFNCTTNFTTAGSPYLDVSFDGLTPPNQTSFVRLNTAGSAFTINTIAGPQNGKILCISNRTGQTMTLANSTGTTTANQIYTGTGSNLIIGKDGVVNLQYSNQDQKWVVRSLGGGAGSGGAYIQAQPAAATSKAGQANVSMAGLGVTFTPTRSGNILVIVSGDFTNQNNGEGGQMQVRYGTGTAPTNQAALAGTAVGAKVSGQCGTNFHYEVIPAAVSSLVTGLTVGTAYWIDVSLNSYTNQGAAAAGTVTLNDVSVSVLEF